MNELIIKKPRITEKSGIQAETSGVYTFEVTACANKKNITKAIKEIYKVTPVKEDFREILGPSGCQLITDNYQWFYEAFDYKI